MTGQDSSTPKGPEATSAKPGDPPVVDSRELLKGQQELRIEHEGQTYRLRVTRTGKLILHK